MKTKSFLLPILVTVLFAAVSCEPKQKPDNPDNKKCTFDITVSDIQTSSIKIKVVPSDTTVNYVMLVDVKENVDKYSTATDYNNDYKAAVGDDAYNKSLYIGAVEGSVSNLNAETEYTIVAYAVDGGEPISDMTKYEFTTAPIPDMSFTISVTDITDRYVHVVVTPSDTTGNFVWLCMPQDYFPNMTAQERAEAYVAKYKPMLDNGFPGMIYTGVQDYDNYKLAPGEKYFIIAFGYNKGITSEVASYEFKMNDGADINSVNIELSVSNVTDTTITVNSKVSSDNFYYLWGVLPSDKFTEEIGKQSVRDMLDQTASGVRQFDPNTTWSMICDTYTFIGSEEDWPYGPLMPETTYTMYAIAINHLTGELADKLFVFKDIFTTKPKAEK